MNYSILIILLYFLPLVDQGFQVKKGDISIYLNEVEIYQWDGLSINSKGHLNIEIKNEENIKADITKSIGFSLTLARRKEAVVPTKSFSNKMALRKFNLEDLLKHGEPGDRLVINFSNTKTDMVNVFVLN